MTFDRAPETSPAGKCRALGGTVRIANRVRRFGTRSTDHLGVIDLVLEKGKSKISSVTTRVKQTAMNTNPDFERPKISL